MKELIKQLRSLKQGGEINPSQEWLTKNRSFLLSQIKKNASQPDKVTSQKFSMDTVWSAMAVFLPRNFVFNVVRPVIVVFLILALGTGGWIATVAASQQSLPGDFLYSFKQADEKARVGVVTAVGDIETETKMRVGFAKRRAEETKKLVSSKDPEKIKEVPNVVLELKKEIKKVDNNLEQTKNESKKGIKANVVNNINKETKKIKEILVDVKVSLAISSSTDSKKAAGEVDSANSAVNETAVKAVEVLVNKHLKGDNSVSKQEVKQAIKSQIESTASETTANKKVLQDAKKGIKKASANKLVTLVSTSSLDVVTGTIKTTSTTKSQTYLDGQNKKVEEITKKTDLAMVEVEKASSEIDKKITKVNKLLSEDNLNQAVKIAHEINDFAKKAEHTTKETIESLQTTLPAVVSSVVVKNADITTSSNPLSLEVKGLSSTTNKINVSTNTVKQSQTTNTAEVEEK